MSTVRRNIVSAIIAIVGVALWLSPLFVYAEADPKITLVDISDIDDRAVKTLCQDVNNGIFEEYGNSDLIFLTYTKESGDGVVEVHMTMYRSSNISQEVRQTIMQIALSAVENSSISRSNRNKVYNELCSLDETTSSLVRQLSSDVRADYVSAYATFRPFSGFFGWVFGLLTLGMFLVLGLTIAVDISYINLPFLQLILHGSNTSEKPKLVSVEAYSAVRESDSKAGESYVSPNSLYLKHKGKQLVIVCVCILYLTSGQIYNIIGIFIDYFRGLIG